MRIQNQEEEKQFANYLLQISERKEFTYTDIGEDIIKLDNNMIFKNEKVKSLISEIFIDLNNNFNSEDYINFIKNRAILTTKNDDVYNINEQIINNFPGISQEFLSADSVEDKDLVHQNLYPIEFLNTLTPSRTPPHKLILKIGAPIILLRNISPIDGLCKHVIDAEIITGSHLGKRVFIPRIRILPSDTDLLFILVRLQFPIRLAFVMTINKAQGQTIPNVSLYLPEPVFAHGQLYVALSRVQSKKDIKILVKNRNIKEKKGVFTKNIVYTEIF